MRRTMRLCAGLALAVTFVVFAIPGRAQDTIASYPPPPQYTANPTKPFDTLLTADIKWLQSKITDRKRKRRFEDNNLRLPGNDQKKTQALIDQLDGELKDADAALAVLKAKQPDIAAQRQLVKAHVTDWITALNAKAESLRKDAADAAQRAKTATKQFDIARAQADEFDDKQNADNVDKEAKALSDDLKAAGL